MYSSNFSGKSKFFTLSKFAFSIFFLVWYVGIGITSDYWYILRAFSIKEASGKIINIHDLPRSNQKKIDYYAHIETLYKGKKISGERLRVKEGGKYKAGDSIEVLLVGNPPDKVITYGKFHDDLMLIPLMLFPWIWFLSLFYVFLVKKGFLWLKRRLNSFNER